MGVKLFFKKSRVKAFFSLLCLSVILFSLSGQEIATFTSSGSFAIPEGVTTIKVEAWGGGGGGGFARNTNGAAGGGGGGGAYRTAVINVTSGDIVAYTVGTGGSGGTTGGTAADAGGTTTFGSVSANGGAAGVGVSTNASGSRGLGGTGGTYNGGAGAAGINGTSSGSSTQAGGGGGSSAGTSSNGVTATSKAGATAPTNGGNGGSGINNAEGVAGSIPGGGGGGGHRRSATDRSGGNGASGQIRVTYLPSIAGNILINPNTTTQLTNTVVGGTWSSAKTSVATINASTGVVTGVAEGTSLITYQTSDGLKVVATLVVIPGTTLPTGSNVFTVPTGVTTIKVEAWGGGGRGASRTSGSYGFGGGGGGAYASGILTVVPGRSYSYTVGAGSSTSSAGENSTFNVNSVVAAGGRSAADNSRSGASGGQASASIAPSGGAKYSGGDGGTSNGNFRSYSGSGGGGAGTSANGGNGSASSTGGAGGTGNIGGAGGAGRNSNGNGYAGVAYGGGGSGAYRTSSSPSGGTGADGAIRITWLPAITGSNAIYPGETSLFTNGITGGVWSSSNSNVATVNSLGLVTGIVSGNVDIIYTVDGLSVKAALRVLSKDDVVIDICAGDDINLAASLPGEWVWMGPNGYLSTNPNPTVTTNANASSAGMYIGGPNLLINGHFENGYTVPEVFDSEHVKGNGSSSALWNEGTYEIGKLPRSYHSNFSSCPDRSGNGNQMIVNGAVTANTLVWKQTIRNLSVNTDYQFSYWIQTVEIANNPATIQFQINGTNYGAVFEAPQTKECGNWKQFTYIWNSGNRTSADLSLLNTNATVGGNDFALDDIVFNKMNFTDTVYIRVASSFTPSVSISADIDPVPAGVNVTYKAIPRSGGEQPTYQWYVNNVPVSGATGATFDYVVGIGDMVTCKMTSSLECASPKTALSNEIAVTGRNYWHGTNTTDWGTASNWTAKRIPAHGQDVEYATADNNAPGGSGNGLGAAAKDLYLDVDRTINNLINLTDKKLVIPTEKSLVVNGSVNTGGNNRILIKAAEGKANGTLAFPNENNPVFATVEMYSKAWIGEEANNNDKYRWQYFGIPVTSLAASPAFDGSWVRIWNEAKSTTTVGKQWDFLINKSVMKPFQGYEITHATARSFSISGQLTKLGLDTTLTVTDASFYRGQHILANPYTAAIYIDSIGFDANMEQTVYIFNTGSFSEWNTGVGKSGTVFSQGIMPGQYLAVPKKQSGYMGQATIPSMQGFLVKVDVKNGKTQGRVKINYSSVVCKNDRAQRVKEPDADYSSLSSEKTYTTVSLQSERNADRLWLFTEEICTPAFDNGWDGFKVISESDSVAQLFSMEQDGNYQVNSTNSIDGAYLGFKAGGDDTDYTLHFYHTNLSGRYQSLYLLDLITGITTDISATESQYSFTASNTTVPQKRFKIIARPKDSGEMDNDGGVNTYIEKKTLYVCNYNESSGQVLVYDISGRKLVEKSFDANTVISLSIPFPTGVYLVKTICDGKEYSKKHIIM